MIAGHCHRAGPAWSVSQFWCRLSEGPELLLRTAISRLGFSARAYHRVLKIARTIADLATAAEIQPAHVSEAIQYRTLDRARA